MTRISTRRRTAHGIGLLAAAVLLSVGLTGCLEGESQTAEPSAPASTPEPTTPAEPTPSPQEPATAEDIEGDWCPTPESDAPRGCVTIALPTATHEDGTVVDIAFMNEENGGFFFTEPGAPFGTFMPAGAALDIPDYYSGSDLPNEDRIWNGQTAVMLVRN